MSWWRCPAWTIRVLRGRWCCCVSTTKRVPWAWWSIALPITGSVKSSRRCRRSEEHTSELQSLMRISYAVFCLKKKNKIKTHNKQCHNNKCYLQNHHIHRPNTHQAHTNDN